jgi:ATP-dependent RNA circularization protein (DNA/RNA ligase family)
MFLNTTKKFSNKDGEGIIIKKTSSEVLVIKWSNSYKTSKTGNEDILSSSRDKKS